MTTSLAALAEHPGGRRWRPVVVKLSSVVLAFAVTAIAEDEPPPASSAPQAAAPRTPGPSHSASPKWLSRVAAATGIPVRALAGYASATITLAKEQPGCGLAWNTLAAIGAVESSHGGHQDGQLLDSGLPSAPIRGPALNGSGLWMTPLGR